MARKRKVPGRRVYAHAGIEIYVEELPVKGRGHDRIWLHVRQPGKTWIMDDALIYVNSSSLRLKRRVSSPARR